MVFAVNEADAFKAGQRVRLGNGQRGVVNEFITSPTGFHSYTVDLDDGRRVPATAPAMEFDGCAKAASLLLPVAVGDRVFHCRVATTPRALARGLQGSAPLQSDEGMLFQFEFPRAATFHMGSVEFPIDIMFVENGRVARVIRSAQPGSRERWGHPRTDAVIEVAAGLAPRVGAEVRAPPLAEDPTRYEVQFPLNVSDHYHETDERWRERSTPDEAFSDAMDSATPGWKDQQGYLPTDSDAEYALRPAASRRRGSTASDYKLTEDEVSAMYAQIMDERGVDADEVGDWTAVMFIAPDGRVVLGEHDGRYRIEDHRMLGGYLPMRVRQDDQLNQLAMRETGLARLLYMGTDHAAIDFETPLTRAQQRVLEQFRASEGIDSFEYHDETGQMHTEDAHTGADAFAVVVLPEQWHGGLDMASVYEVWWDTSDTTAAMAWIQQEDNAREIRQDGHESVAVATLRLTDDAYDIEPRNWHILEESHELVEVPNVFIGEAFADQYGISELWPNRWAIPETPDEMIEELRDMLKDDDLNASTKGIIRDAISGAGMAKRGQVALDPAESVIGAIEGMLASGGLQWTQDTLNPLVSYAVVTPDDVARWVAAHEMSGSESTDTLSALTSNEGMQIIGDGLVLAGVAQIANVATADDGHVLVLWMESNDKS